ncbi:YhcN/YlaJ family sporulation lipoprotein [Ferviditalea candida]|uniref:YhcN/YlaJ family sporulation lipoprotein n=1 Tax=Ferviditalea candida TaxID=3108399 RepID=A0ABU5ZD33_9BACL|nr:YhcN/YlaJ family sporulation lipoprotein [Paenibacillaceae bacterium T2]
MKLQVLKLTMVGVLALSSLAACTPANREGAGTTDQIGTRSIRPYGLDNRLDMNRWDNRRGTNYTTMHNNTRMEMSQAIADRIARMPEVDSAYVLLTDKNAYVAVVLDNARVGNRNNVTNINGMRTPDRTGVINRNRARGLTGYTGLTDNRINGGGAGAGVGNLVSPRDGITGNRDTIYGRTTDTVTNGLKNKISQQVKAVKPDIRNVFVSANPEFVNRMTGYAQRFRNGQPLRGMILEFNTMVERIFPQRANFNRTDMPAPYGYPRGTNVR